MAVLRILDANLNRALEGLRVVEEYARFVCDNGQAAGQVKRIRHDLVAALASVPRDELLAARDTTGDVGTEVTTTAEYVRGDAVDVAHANLKRVEQSLRALEEYGKILSPQIGQDIERLRYAVYSLAKTIGQPQHRVAQLAEARLYILIDSGPSMSSFIERATLLVDAGAHVLQLRDKQLMDANLLQRARALRTITRGRCLFIMNDRPDLAALADADGVHVGQDELSVQDARRIVGPHALVGVSTHNIEQARQAVANGADYIGCGPTFESKTKAFAMFAGVEFLREVAAEIRIPAFAIGGITLENVGQVLAAGMSRIAVGSAITDAENPAEAAKEFVARLANIPSD
jgi:thiamine-phosphate pyrophosphorylase